MTKVIALRSFEHSGSRRRDSRFDVSERVAQALLKKGLVDIVYDPAGKAPVPVSATGEKSSASPAARASRRRTARQSTPGEQEQTSGE